MTRKEQHSHKTLLRVLLTVAAVLLLCGAVFVGAAAAAFYDVGAGTANSLEEAYQKVAAGGTITVVAGGPETSQVNLTGDKSVTLDLKNGQGIWADSSKSYTDGLINWNSSGTLTITGTGALSGAGTTRVLNIASGEVKMEGGLITNGNANKNTTSRNQGCGVLVDRSGKFTMSGSASISNNSNTSCYGGGVYVYGTFSMYGGSITENTANRGGGVFVGEGSTFVMNDGTISYNMAGSYGGGVYLEHGSTFTMDGGRIIYNSAAEKGGGVYDAGTFILTKSGYLFRNTATEGAGVYVAGSAKFITRGGTILENKVPKEGGSGGGVFAASGAAVEVCGDVRICGNLAGFLETPGNSVPNNVVLASDNQLTLTGKLNGEILITSVGGISPSKGGKIGFRSGDAGQDDAKKIKDDDKKIYGGFDLHVEPERLMWVVDEAIEAEEAPFEKGTATLTHSKILNSVTTTDSRIGSLNYIRSNTVDRPPETIDGKQVVQLGDSFKLHLLDKESSLSPVYDVSAVLEGKVGIGTLKGRQAEDLCIAQETPDGTWTLLPTTVVWSSPGIYTFTAKFITMKPDAFALVIAEGSGPTPTPKKSSSPQGSSIWLTAAPTPTATPTPAPTVTQTPEVPSVKPVASETPAGKSPVPFMGILAGLGCAAVLFGLRRK